MKGLYMPDIFHDDDDGGDDGGVWRTWSQLPIAGVQFLQAASNFLLEKETPGIRP